MNMVVYVVIVLAGALAFVVLFTLSSTNISERERELATIKVLGFHDSEVHRYVNKETLILTAIGIAAGLPVGVLLSNFLGAVLKMPAIVYSATIHPVSYLLAAVIAFVFALIVDLMTNRILNRIDPIEALKSVE
jgi:putative ABC transport system permease protein